MTSSPNQSMIRDNTASPFTVNLEDTDDGSENKKVWKKLQEGDLFTGQNFTDQDVQKFLNLLSSEDSKNILETNLDKGYDDSSTKDKMDFINRMPYESKVELIKQVSVKFPASTRHLQVDSVYNDGYNDLLSPISGISNRIDSVGNDSNARFVAGPALIKTNS